MRLTRIELENFKGFGRRQVIDLRPITLLFGPNSSGKSTILQALHYLHEILYRGNVNPDRIEASDLINLGGFTTLVHKRRLDRTVKIKVELAVTDEPNDDGGGGWDEELNYKAWAHFRLLTKKFPFDESRFKNLPIAYFGSAEEFKRVGLEISVSWNELERKPYISRIETEINGQPLLAIVSSVSSSFDESRKITDFNFAHPLLRHVDRPEGEEDSTISMSPLLDEIRFLLKHYSHHEASDTSDDNLSVEVSTNFGECSVMDCYEISLSSEYKPNKTYEQFKDRTKEYEDRWEDIGSLFSEMILGSARLICYYLNSMIYIGPLREIPDRNFRPQSTPDRSRWANGLAAWDLLYQDYGGAFVYDVNKWLCSRTPYGFKRADVKQVITTKSDDGNGLSDLSEILPKRSEIFLHDENLGWVAPCDVGIGISQMVPVVVASLLNHDGFLLIEQPELHIHPALQIDMGDLFIEATNSYASGRRSLIVETHSEHIILRLLRRIRERTEKEVPSWARGLDPDNLSVIYVENDEDGVRCRRIRVSKEGDFLDRWPHGFFMEQAEELF